MLVYMKGFLLLDKKEGITSAKALYPIKKLLPNKTKVGHAGTLDPFASGLLVVAIGKATKVIEYVVSMSKTYEFTVQWGIATNTDDLTGVVVARSSHIPSLDEILSIIPKFSGNIRQKPPIFSAIHVAGRRAYDLARSGSAFEIPERSVTVLRLSLLSHSDSTTKFLMECSKGCYVRSIARDMGIALHTCAHVIELRRVAIGIFDVNDASDDLEKAIQTPHMITVEQALQNMPQITLDDDIIAKIKNGQSVQNTNLYDCGTHDSVAILDRYGTTVAICSLGSDCLIIPQKIL